MRVPREVVVLDCDHARGFQAGPVRRIVPERQVPVELDGLPSNPLDVLVVRDVIWIPQWRPEDVGYVDDHDPAGDDLPVIHVGMTMEGLKISQAVLSGCPVLGHDPFDFDRELHDGRSGFDDCGWGLWGCNRPGAWGARMKTS